MNAKAATARPASAKREAGTASALQIPPKPSSAPPVPTKPSARGAKAATCAAAEPGAELLDSAGTSHGNQSNTPPAASRKRPATSAITTPKTPPVGVSEEAQSASQEAARRRLRQAHASTGASHAATASDHCPCRRRSRTKGLATAHAIAAAAASGVCAHFAAPTYSPRRWPVPEHARTNRRPATPRPHLAVRCGQARYPAQSSWPSGPGGGVTPCHATAARPAPGKASTLRRRAGDPTRQGRGGSSYARSRWRRMYNEAA